MEEQGKLDTLVDGFRKLDESQKNYIRDLTRKLLDIHQGGDFEKSHTSGDLTFEQAG
jgi:hypothetical protein